MGIRSAVLPLVVCQRLDLACGEVPSQKLNRVLASTLQVNVGRGLSQNCLRRPLGDVWFAWIDGQVDRGTSECPHFAYSLTGFWQICTQFHFGPGVRSWSGPHQLGTAEIIHTYTAESCHVQEVYRVKYRPIATLDHRLFRAGKLFELLHDFPPPTPTLFFVPTR